VALDTINQIKSPIKLSLWDYTNVYKVALRLQQSNQSS
jgi:hypothetical protein